MKQRKKKIGLVLASALAGAGTVSGALVALASCGDNSTIPTEYLKTENGKVTGFTKDISELGNYKTLLIPEKDSSGNAITGIAENAFSQLIGNSYGLNIETVIIKKNVKQIDANAFYGCHTIKTFDLSDYSQDDINTLMDGEHVGLNAFAIMNEDGAGAVKFNNNVDDTTKNNAKIGLAIAGVPINWYKEEEKPAISDLVMQPATTVLQGKQYFANGDTKAWDVTYEGTSVAAQCEWQIIPRSADFPTGEITIQKEIVSEKYYTKWSSNIKPGIYDFYVQAVYKLPSGETTHLLAKQAVTLTIKATEFTLTGPTSASGKSYIAGQFTQPFVTKFDGEQVKPTYTINSDPSGKLTIDDSGYVHWGELPVGSHPFTIKASYRFDAGDKSKVLDLVSDEGSISISDRKVTITNPKFPATIYELTAGKSLTPFTATVTDNASDVTLWTLHQKSGPTAGSLSIDGNGYVNWTNTIQAGLYQFYVVADIDGKWQGTSEIIEMNVGTYDTIITGGERSLTSYDYTPGAGVARALEVNGVEIPNVQWYLEGDHPDGVTVDKSTGAISWNDTVPAGTYNFAVHGYCADYKGKARDASENFTLYVNQKQYAVTGGSKTLDGKEYSAGEDTNSWVATAPASNETKVWSLRSVDGSELPSGLKIENGLVKWDDTVPAGTYRFYVDVTVDGHWYGESDTPVVLTVVEKALSIVNPSSTTITTEDYHSGTSTQQWAVKLDTTIDVTDKVEWSFQATSGYSLPAGIGMDSTGHLTWGNDVDAGTYKFSMIALYNYHGKTKTSTSNEVTMTVAKTPVTINNSAGKTDFTGDIRAASTDTTTTWSVEVDGETVPTSRLNWYFLNDQYEKVLPEGQVGIDSAGHFFWGNAIGAGEYTLNVWVSVDGNWFGTYATPIKLTIVEEHDLTNADLEINADGYVTGIKTNISGYQQTHSLIIEVDGTNVKGIKTLKGRDNQNKIADLIINSSVDLDLTTDSDNVIQLNWLKSITLKNTGSGTYTKIDSSTFFGDDSVCSRRTVETINLDGVDIGEFSFGALQSTKRWYAATKLTLNNIRSIDEYAFANFGSTKGCEIEGLDTVLGNTTTDLAGATSAFYQSYIKLSGDLTIKNPYIAYSMFDECQFFEPNLIFTDSSSTQGITIATYAFSESPIKSVEFKDAPLTKVNDYAFESCTSLTYLKFNKAIDTIGAAPFKSCSSLHIIDVQEMDVTAPAEATLATNLTATSFKMMSTEGKLIAKDEAASIYWYNNFLDKLTSGWTIAPNSFWKMQYEIDSHITIAAKPSTWDYQNDFEQVLTSTALYQIDMTKSYIQLGDTKYTSEIEGKLEFHIDTRTQSGRVFISKNKLQEVPTGGTIKIHLETVEAYDIQLAANSGGILRQHVEGGDYYARFTRFIKSDNIDLENIELTTEFLDMQTSPRQVVSPTKYDLQIIDDLAYADSFDVYVRMDADAFVHSGVWIADGILAKFTFTDKRTAKQWVFENQLFIADAPSKLVGNEAFTIENKVMTEVKREVFESVNLFGISLEFDGETVNELASTALKPTEWWEMGQYIYTIAVTLEENQDKQITLSEDTVAQYMCPDFVQLVNKTNNPSFLTVKDPDTFGGQNHSLIDIQLTNCVVENCFQDFPNLTLAKIDKGTVLNEKSFSNLKNFCRLDLSDWDVIPTTWKTVGTDPSTDPGAFYNVNTQATRKIVYISDLSLKDAWIEYLVKCGLTDAASWTYAVAE